jgi:hypothetical protein
VFRYNAFMLFTRTFDAIFELAPIMRELFGHFVDPAWHIATDYRREGHPFTDKEFMRGIMHTGWPAQPHLTRFRARHMIRSAPTAGRDAGGQDLPSAPD